MEQPNFLNTPAQDANEDIYSSYIHRFLKVEEITWGNARQQFLVRYRGQLYREDTATVYDEVAALVKPLGVTPLFRMQEGKHTILLVKGLITPRPSNPMVNLVMFLLTLASVMLAGGMYAYKGPVPENFLDWLNVLAAGWPFALSMLGILGAHEFGHYLAARYHKTSVTLPYFIPMPVSILGTMGAFIQIKEPPKNRNILLDIGLAGPLAGLVIAIPVLVYGLLISPISQLPAEPNSGLILEGNSLLYLLMKFLVKGELLPAPASYGGVAPAIYWLRYLFTSSPLPWGGMDVTMDAVLFAGWAGLLVTAMNLIPAGQLDGGHSLYALFGDRASRVRPFIIGGLLLMGLAWSGWWLWAGLIFFLGRAHLEPLDTITPLSPSRRWLAVAAVVLFILVFIPVPLIEINGF